MVFILITFNIVHINISNMISTVLKELKVSFGLKKAQTQILEALSEKDLSADAICEKTGIPKGRIYELLNEMIEWRLLKKIDQKGMNPSMYSFSPYKSKVLDFLRHRLNEQISKETCLVEMLEEPGLQRVEVIEDSKSYEFHVMGFLSGAEWIKAIHRNLSLPWFIYPWDEEEFFNIRKIIMKRRQEQQFTSTEKSIMTMKLRAYKEIYSKKPAEQIMTKLAFESYLKIIREAYEKKELREWAENLMKNLETHDNVKLFVIENPYSLFTNHISDKSVISITVHGGKLSGIKLLGEKTVELYSDAFDEMKERAQPFEEYLKPLI